MKEKKYIGSQEHFEDEVNAYYDQQEMRDKYQQQQPQQSLPPAEGAEAFIRAKIADHKLHDCYPTFVPEMAQAMTEFAAQQQPTAEGAEDILEKHMKLCSIQPINGGYPKFVVLVAMTEFAEQLTTLYAQRIADKMVEERLRDAFDAGMDYDRMIHGNCIDGVDFETWYNRLKSRESHDSKS